MSKKMKFRIRLIGGFILLLAATASAAAERPATIDRAGDEAGIRKIITMVQDGWNAGDGEAFASPFAEDADYVVVNGMRIKGRQAIAAGHQNIFNTVYKGSNISATVQSIRFLRDDVAVVHIAWHLKYRINDAAHETRSMNSMVMTKQEGRWSIAAFHNTPIASAHK